MYETDPCVQLLPYFKKEYGYFFIIIIEVKQFSLTRNNDEKENFMKRYTYQLPLAKGSIKQIVVYDENNEVINTFKRTYKTILHQIFDAWIGKNQLLCHYEGYDVAGNIIIESYKKHGIVKRTKNMLSFVENRDVKELFTAEIDGIDAITPTYKIESPNTKLKTKIDFSRLVHFNEEGNIVAILQLHFSSTHKKLFRD